MLLLRVVAGSRLYGTAGPGSDYDWFEVHDHIRARQIIRDGQDVIRVGLSQWLLNAEKGTHQALDAMWAPPEYAEVDLLTRMRLHFRPDPWRASDQLMRTAKSMSFDPVKGEKHGRRLEWCAQRVRERGWYDPSSWVHHR